MLVKNEMPNAVCDSVEQLHFFLEEWTLIFARHLTSIKDFDISESAIMHFKRRTKHPLGGAHAIWAEHVAIIGYSCEAIVRVLEGRRNYTDHPT
ncbi:hypothetical protein BMS3Bbin04_01328 [bacterium BMS3Bbin04]|nr:hypothetical protein BMS3Bbin04_01328 [bacterium BMS3Bbin04]